MATKVQESGELVGRGFLRSANIEQDFLDAVPFAVLPTHSVQRCLSLMLRGVTEPAYRAQMLTGAYGSGKSAVALVLARLLDTRTGAAERRALSTSMGALGDSDLLESAVAHYRVVAASARKEALGGSLLRAVRSAFVGSESILRSSGWLQFARGVETGGIPVDDTSIVEQLQSLAYQTVHDTGERGLIVIVDELGQVLEHAAEHAENGDMHLLQVVAEAAVRSDSPEFWFLGVLHRGSGDLSSLLGKRGRDQWRKVEQRFIEIPCTPDREDTIRLIGAAVSSGRTRERVPAAVTSLIAGCQPLRPASLTPRAFGRLCMDAYPLHPAVLLALPLLAQELGQGHRSVLSFILGPEPHGFQEWCSERLPRRGGVLFGLPDLYDYVRTVLPIRREADVSEANTLADAEEVLVRLGRGRDTEAAIIKCIAVMDLVGGSSGLKPSEAVIGLSLMGLRRDAEQVPELIKVLEKERHIVFRPIGGRYHVWQGSDVDLAARALAAHEALDSTFSLADALQALEPPVAIAARRHSIDTGVLRVIPGRVVSVSQLPKAIESAPRTGVVLYCLATSAEELETAKSTLRHCARHDILGVLARDSGQVATAAQEVAVLDWIAQRTPELEGDRAARRELSQRILEVRTVLRLRWATAFASRAGGMVFWKGNAIESTSKRLRVLASEMCNEIYDQSPKVRNELLNCDKLSSQAAAARHALVDHMVTSRTRPLLGIEGYPPERSMYECVLRETGIHRRQVSGEWGLGQPLTQDRSRMFPVWRFMEQAVRSNAPAKQTGVNDMMSSLCAPPFGLTLGLVSTVLIAFILSNDASVSVYEDGVFVPHLSTPLFERMLKSPGTFVLGWSKATGTRQAVVARLARGLNVAEGTVPVVRGLLQRISTLPGFSLHTHRVAQQTLQLRQVLTAAKSPEKLLYVDLPTALGCQPVADDRSAGNNFSDETEFFFDRLNAGLNELSGAYNGLLEMVGRSVRAAFGVPDSEARWRQAICQRAALCATVATDVEFRITLLHAQDVQSGDEQYLESVAASLTGSSPRGWTDEDASDFGRRATVLQATVLDTEARLSLEQRLDGEPGLLLALHGSDGFSRSVVFRDSELSSEAVAKAVLKIQRVLGSLTKRERAASLTLALDRSAGRSASTKGS